METFLGQMLFGAQRWRGSHSGRREGAAAPTEGGKEPQEPQASQDLLQSVPLSVRQASWGYGAVLCALEWGISVE